MLSKKTEPVITDNEQIRKYLRRRIKPEGTYAELLEFPSYFEIETVNACNARCPMCTIAEWTRKTPTMRNPLFEKIADELIENRKYVKRVSLYRDGEPLLDKKLADRTAVLKQGGINEVAISSNVALLDEQKSRDLLEAGLDTIIMSIDSLKKDVYEAIRVKCDFEVVMANAQRFIELRNQIRPSSKVWVRMIRQESNYDEWPAFEAFWKERLADNDRVNYHTLHNWGSQLKGFNAVEENSEYGIPCVALWSLMVIFGNGDVPLCNVDYNNIHPCGSVAESSIRDVWRAQTLERIRHQHLNGEKAKTDICANCNVWSEPPDVKKVERDFQ